MSAPEPLPSSSLLAGLPAGVTGSVAAAAARRTIAGGAMLFREGEPAEALFMVLSGRLKLTQLSPGGQEVVVRFVAPGDVFGGLAVLDGKAYPFGASAVEPSRVMSWSRPVLLRLFAELPEFRANVLAIVGGHGREMLDRVRELSTEPVPQRLARALRRLADAGQPTADGGRLVQGVTQQDLADMAGTTLYTVSRTLAEWEREGVLVTGRGRVEIRSMTALDRLAVG